MEAATTVREHDVAGRRTGPGSGPDTRWPGQRQMVRAAQLAFGASVLDCALLETWHGGARVYLFVPAEVPELVTLRAGAVAASILTAIWHILRDGAVYQDLGADHFHKRSPERQAHHLARQIAKLGFTCSITPTPGVVSA
jgi:hypothetical protein